MAKTAVIAPKRRRLTDLYVTGKLVEIDDGSGDDPIEVWISKISPIEQRDASDAATKARAKILALRNVSKRLGADEFSEQLAAYSEQLEDIGVTDRETRIAYLISPKLQEAFVSNQARIASEEEWSKNDYLESLQKLWNDEMKDKFEADEEDEEAKHVYDELMRFTKEVNDALGDDRDTLAMKYEHMSDDELVRLALDRTIEAEADFAWVNDFSRWQVFYATRDPENHHEHYFTDRLEVDSLDPKVLDQLLTEYQKLAVDSIEGKDSEATPNS